MIYPELLNIVISVDNDEWYYGRPENRANPDKRTLVNAIVPENTVVSQYHAREINEYFNWMKKHERDTTKHKKRAFYVDNGFFLKSRQA